MVLRSYMSVYKTHLVKNRVPKLCAEQLKVTENSWFFLLVGGLEHFFPFSWECHHPN